MSPLAEIEYDLQWRESELAILKLLLANEDIGNREKLVLFRAGWALLYAHYEGFCKFALTVYYDGLRSMGKCHRDLPVRTQSFALSATIKTFRHLPAVDLVRALQSFEADHMSRTVKFPEVDTQSNLWAETLKSLLDDADISLDAIESHNRKINTLVSRRNKIAHGERDMITEYNYFISFEKAVMDVMVELALRIDAKLKEQ